MKTQIVAVWTAGMVWGLAVTAMTPAEQDRLFMEAVRLNQQGSYAEAEIRLNQLLESQPNRSEAKALLTTVQARLQAQREDPSRRLAQRLEAIVLPEVSFRDAVVKDVILFLQREAASRVTEKESLNFVWLVPSDVEVPRVTLALRQTPISEVLRYVTQMVGLRYRVDGHAVVIYKPDAMPAPVKNAGTQ